MSAPPPKRNPIPFGTYLLLDRINIGGMAEVWRGKSFGAGGFERLVAIKRILPNIAEEPDFKSMFIDEAKISVLLAHANIAQTYELGELHQSLYIAMEYVAGKDLRVVFDRARKLKAPLPIPLVCHVILKASEGLDHAHRKKDQAGRDLHIVHRDVSPQNILLSYDGEVKVIDFGIAKANSKATTTQAGVLKGKFGYMSPEQILGHPLDRRSDVFALGVCLRELLTGERLFTGDSDYSVLDKVRNVDLRGPSGTQHHLPPDLERIVMRALAKEPEDRYPYASDLADDLERYLVTSGHFFGRKDLMEYMHSTFCEDVDKEAARQLEYASVEATPEILASIESDREAAPIAARIAAAPAPRPEPASSRPAEEKTTVGFRRPQREAQALQDDGESTSVGPWPREQQPPTRSTPGTDPRRTLADRTPVLGTHAAASPVPRDEEDTTGAGAPQQRTLSRPASRERGPRSEPDVRPLDSRSPGTGQEEAPAPSGSDVPTVGLPTRLAELATPGMSGRSGDASAGAGRPDPDETVGPASFAVADEPTPVSRRRERHAESRQQLPDGDDTDHGPRPLGAAETFQRPRRLAVPRHRGEGRALLAGLFDAKARVHTRRDLWLAAGVGAIAMLVLAVLASIVSGSSRKGTVVVEVFGVPAPMTTIRMDGRTLPTPAQFPVRTEAPLGTVEIELSAAGYRPSTHVVQLSEPGAVAEVRTSLEPLPR